MTFSNADIVTLAKAGFTAQQIAALSATGVQQTTQSPNSTTQPVQQDSTLKLLETMQLQNIINASQPPVQTTDDILANIIRPTMPENTGGTK